MALFLDQHSVTAYGTKEEADRCRRYFRALYDLAQEDDRFKSNFRWFQRALPEKRNWWVARIEADVAAGKHNTVAADIVVRAISLRLDE